MSAPARITLPMPRLGETIEEGTIAEWLIAPGQSFARGDALLEVETDKTMVEYPALGEGTLVETLVDAGDVVTVGTPIAVIEAAAMWEGLESAASEDLGVAMSEDPAPPDDARPDDAPPSPAGEGQRPRATPLARRIAAQNDIALDRVTGTGRRGRIEAGDVRALIASPARSGGTVDTALCVHGFAGLGSNWAKLRARLQRAGLAAQAPDMPGHGRSDSAARRVGDLVDWLAEDLAAQTTPLHLIGHSLGAHVAALATLRDPSRVARLTLIAPLGCGIEISGAFVHGMATSPTPAALSHLMRLLGPSAAALDATALAAMAEALAADRLGELAADIAGGDSQRLDTIAALRALPRQVPVTAIFGLHDRIIPREHVFNLPPNVASHVVAAGHMPHWDATDDVAAILTASDLPQPEE